MSYKTIIEPRDNGYVGILKDSQENTLFITSVENDIKTVSTELMLFATNNLPKISLTSVSVKATVKEQTNKLVPPTTETSVTNQTIPSNLKSFIPQKTYRKCCGRG